MVLWPTWMDDAGLKAKSVEFGDETLAQHTWQVLSRLKDQFNLRPYLTELTDQRLWTRMYWACFLHDFGKAASGFQEVLRGVTENEWRYRRHRHEILSLAFVDWLFPKGHPDREWIIATIAFHHKDAEEISEKYGGQLDFRDMMDDNRESVEEMVNGLVSQIEQPTCALLWHWLNECGETWATHLGIWPIDVPTLLPLEQASAINLARSTFKALRAFNLWVQQLSVRDQIAAMVYRGLIFTADHSASAGTPEFPAMPSLHEAAQRPLKGVSIRHHQKIIEQAPVGSAILIAPTGSGKTEAAMLWAAAQHQQRPVARLFYTLPYQASMNAMYKRLGTRFLGMNEAELPGNNQIIIQHSRAVLKLYQDMMELDERNPRDVQKEAKRLKNLAQLNAFPLQVFSPYQMLKAAYSLRGYETLLVDYTDALFIFDEIHAYEPKRLAMILKFMGWLARECRARFLVMTATLPPTIQTQLEREISPVQIISASKEDFEKSQRHTVHILEGSLLEQIVERVRCEIDNGQSVLVCCNRIAHAQRVYFELQDQLCLKKDQDIVLLHGRFNGKDRSDKEKILSEAAGVRSEKRRKPFVVVATQVVEVSLDIDLDIIYTDPAPLEALLQRFGRVNRGRKAKQLCPVYVFQEPSESLSKKPYLPYDERLVKRSVQVLQDHFDGKPIDESQVTELLGNIYQDAILRDWQTEYDQAAKEFEQAVLKAMRPFQSADLNLWKNFHSLFDGIEVLPVDCMNAYYEARERSYLEASQYLVNISSQNYGEFKNKYGLIIPAKSLEGEYADHIDVPYDSDLGLQLDEVRHQHKALQRLSGQEWDEE